MSSRSRPGRPCAQPSADAGPGAALGARPRRGAGDGGVHGVRARGGAKLAAWTPLDAQRAGHPSWPARWPVTSPRTSRRPGTCCWPGSETTPVRGQCQGADRQAAADAAAPAPCACRAPCVLLLRYTAEISVEGFGELQERLLDDNDRTDLCRELDRGRLVRAVPGCSGDDQAVRREPVKGCRCGPGSSAAGQPECRRRARGAVPTARAGRDEVRTAGRVAGAQAMCAIVTGPPSASPQLSPPPARAAGRPSRCFGWSRGAGRHRGCSATRADDRADRPMPLRRRGAHGARRGACPGGRDCGRRSRAGPDRARLLPGLPAGGAEVHAPGCPGKPGLSAELARARLRASQERSPRSPSRSPTPAMRRWP